MTRIPNRTAQAGTFYTGTPDYVDVSAGAALSGMVTFPAKATGDSWADADVVGVSVVVDDSNYQVWVGEWDETNEYILLDTLEESVGTIANTAAVEITATLTSSVAEAIANA